MSYVATANSIKYVGAKPVFAEIDPANYNLDVKDAEKKITAKTKAILLVHQIGMPADIDAFKKLADKAWPETDRRCSLCCRFIL